jgi:outer membrane protein assembly factor BamB
MTRRAWATLLVLASLGGGLAGGEATRKAGYEIDYKTHRVLRRDGSGKVLWSTQLGGYAGGVRPPHLLWDADRVYVTDGDGVTALSAKTGKSAWHTKGPNDRMLLSGRLLLAVDCGSTHDIEIRGRSFVAYAVATGKEVFRVRLPQSNHFDPEPIREVGGLFLVQVGENTDGKGDARLIDRKGKVVHRLDRQVIAGVEQGKDRVLLTSRDLVRLSPDGKKRWSVRLDHEWIAGGGLVALKGGDLVVFLHGLINDSGVQMARVDPASGKVVWRHSCKPLGVDHSKYRHTAAVAVEGDRLRVTSRGSGGTFVELLDLKSGKQLKRTRPKGDDAPRAANRRPVHGIEITRYERAPAKGRGRQ